jgi:hypothetical protein
MAADDFEVPVSFAKRLIDFCAVCFNLATIAYGFYSFSTQHFLAGSLSNIDPVDLTF